MLRFAFRVGAASAAQTFVVNNDYHTCLYRGHLQSPTYVQRAGLVIISTIPSGVLRFASRVGAASAAQTSAVNNSITRSYTGATSSHPPMCNMPGCDHYQPLSYGVLRFAFRVGAASAAQTFVVNNIITRAYTGATSSHPPMCNVPGCDHFNHPVWRVAICVPCRCRKRCADLRCEQ